MSVATAQVTEKPPIERNMVKQPVLGNSTWREPLTIDELVRNRMSLLGDKPVVSYPSSGTNYVDYSLRQLDTFAFRVAKKLAVHIPPRDSSSYTPSVVALLGPSDLNYLVTLLALSKLGHTVLFLSTRISTDACTSLLDNTGSKHLIFDVSFWDTTKELQKHNPTLQIHEMPAQDTYDYPLHEEKDAYTNLARSLTPEFETKYVAWIIHSSGSTGLPKPIFQTHQAAIRNYAINMNMNGFITLPLYHNHGLSCLFRTIHSCKRIHLYNASLPLAKQYLLDIMRAHDFEIFYGVPYALKLLAETSEGIEALARFKIVMFGGSACPDSLGDKLVANGVNLVSHYGATETGQLMTSFRPREDKGWDYLRPSDSVKPYLRFEERAPGIFELICLDGWPSKVMSNRPDGSYATKDLFMKHPTIEAYKYYARLDDTIILVNGEKVNPLAMEGTIRQDGVVSEAVVFGAGKTSVGLMIIPSEDASGLSTEQIIDRIWPAVERVQTSMPAYGHLSRDMVKVLPADTQYPRTDKGTVIRQAFYRQFSQIIEDAYEENNGTEETLALSEPELKSFLREQLQNILPLKNPSALTDGADFFGLGMDSLQATQLRSILVKRIDTNGQKLGLNVAFDYPTINSLAHHLHSLKSGDTTDKESIEELMEKLITKYSSFERHKPLPNGLCGRYIVLTGATGSLGSHIAAKLASLPDVQKVYCLVRAGSTIEAYDRLLKSMRERRVYEDLPDSARSKLSALPSDISQTNLGLDSTIYNVLTSEITDLIHCAWSVNFNLHLNSFEKDSISGLKNLIDLCLKSQRPASASFNFCSSVSTVINTEGEVPEALPMKLSYAQNMGYAQSKLIGEHICNQAAEKTGIQARVLRIGQIIGDTKHGIWNPTEAIPLMLQSATTIGALPRLDESPLWLPVDVVADTVVEISLSLSTTKDASVFNIINHNSFNWTCDLLPYLRQAGLEFEELDQREWLKRLRESNPDPAVNPPIKLVEFFTNKYGAGEPRRTLEWCTHEARRSSPALAGAKGLDQEMVAKMVEYFRTKWVRK
ncbi:hypothetical protein VTN00DRAFT_4738 [Thermoascus crustaceus]|uniref:uncharacterized protein n=1 Tax=Thermoascus crustaceus TaxID=5088 RepID=UPI003742A2AB